MLGLTVTANDVLLPFSVFLAFFAIATLLIGTFVGGDCLKPGVDLLKKNNILVFEELEFTYRALGHLSWTADR